MLSNNGLMSISAAAQYMLLFLVLAVKSDRVSSPDLIRRVYRFQILKAIRTGVGSGSGTETKSELFQIYRVTRTQAALLRALGASVRENKRVFILGAPACRILP